MTTPLRRCPPRSSGSAPIVSRPNSTTSRATISPRRRRSKPIRCGPRRCGPLPPIPADKQAIAVLRGDPAMIGKIGTTCVPTMVNGGHALNALPQRATAIVNCRIFPGHTKEDIMAELAAVAGQPEVKFSEINPEYVTHVAGVAAGSGFRAGRHQCHCQILGQAAGDRRPSPRALRIPCGTARWVCRATVRAVLS